MRKQYHNICRYPKIMNSIKLSIGKMKYKVSFVLTETCLIWNLKIDVKPASVSDRFSFLFITSCFPILGFNYRKCLRQITDLNWTFLYCPYLHILVSSRGRPPDQLLWGSGSPVWYMGCTWRPGDHFSKAMRLWTRHQWCMLILLLYKIYICHKLSTVWMGIH